MFLIMRFFFVFCSGLLVLDDDDEEEDEDDGQGADIILDEPISGQQQQSYGPARGSSSSSMGRLNGRQISHPTTTASSAVSSGSHQRSGMMMAQHVVPHYQLPPTPPHHAVHPHLGYVHPHHLHPVANNSCSSTKDVNDMDMDTDPTTLLKQPSSNSSSSHSKFIPSGKNQFSTFSCTCEHKVFKKNNYFFPDQQIFVGCNFR